jgi:K+/H+ antiporter YhaU regulatory subunit KhtT
MIGKTISQMKFWQNTGGTIIAIRRDNSIVLSPGPYAELKNGDVIVVVGDEGTLNRVNNFLYKR